MDSSRPSDVDKEAKSDMKDAVSFLLKGGSLLSAPCAICKGVQIKYKNEIICINCGKQRPADEIIADLRSARQFRIAEDQFHDQPSHSSDTFEDEIEERIAEQFKILKSEYGDMYKEKQRIELIEKYLDLLDRLRNYSKKAP
jgi:uncharacterized Zn finger protein (UPF0148 family)